MYGPFDVDLFASRVNKKVSSYVSWQKDHQALHIDAFTLTFQMYNKCRRYTTETALGDIFKYVIVRSHSQNDTAFQSLDFVDTSKLGRVEEVPIP